MWRWEESIIRFFLQIEGRKAGKKLFNTRLHVTAARVIIVVVIIVARVDVAERQPLWKGFH